MDDSPQDVYAKCLPNSRGYPLWFPEPSSTFPTSYQQDGLQIGDVGYVSRKGTFNVLLNICFGPNHALHRRPGFSFTFDPIPLDIDHEVNTTPNADPPGCVITSSGITQPSQASQRAGHYEFTPSSAKGAILILPDGATSHDLPANERFRKVAIERAFDWYEIAKEQYGDNISNGSLYLITGFYKARSWSLAAFHDATATEPRHIWVVPREREGSSSGREWKCTFPVQYRDGPGPGYNGNVNQTVYICGFKIAVRDDVLGWLSQKPEVQPIPAIQPRKGSCGFARFLLRLLGKKNPSKRRQRERANGVADVNHVPLLSQPFHPSDVINRYLLSKDPDALVAVTHDSEWMTLIETGQFTPEELTQGDRLEEFLLENYLLVSQPANNAVYLKGKCKDHGVSSKSESFWYARSVSFPVIITRIRANDVIAGFRRMPVGFCVLVHFDGIKWRTKNKSVRLHGNDIEWDDKIQLPSEPSVKVQISLCASFEFSPMLGDGEILRTVETCVRDLIDNTHVITFSPADGGLVSPCSSLLLTMGRRGSHDSGAAPDEDTVFDWEESSDLAQLTNQGHDALLHYRDDPRKENVGVSLAFFEHALAICPPGHQCYAAALCNLARAHFIYSQINSGPMELSTSISYYREALALRSVGHSDRPATLLHLAEILLYRYGKLGFEEFPGEIVELVSEVHDGCSVDSHERRAADLALQTYALYKANNSCSLVDIDKLVPALRQAVIDAPQDYFDKLQRLTNLGRALLIRYESCGDLDDLEESIATHEAAMQFTPCGHPDEPAILTNLGILLLRRFRRSDDFGDLIKSDYFTSDAVRCTPVCHFDYPSRLAILGGVFLTRFQRLRQNEYYFRSNTIFHNAQFIQPHHPELPVVLITFAVSRFTQFGEFRDLGDLDSAIALVEEALQLTAHGHFARPRMLSTLGFFYSTRFETSADLVDLRASISCTQEALELTPRVHFDHPTMVAALRRYFFLCFSVFGWLDGLEKPTDLLVETTSDDDLSKFSTLARSLFEMHSRPLDDLLDLDEVISTLEWAEQLALEGLFNRAKVTMSLVAALRARFRELGGVEDLDRSIGVLEEALALTPVGHAARSKMMTSLGISYDMRRLRQRQQQSDMLALE